MMSLTNQVHTRDSLVSDGKWLLQQKPPDEPICFLTNKAQYAVPGLAHDGKSLHLLPGEDLPQTWVLSVVLNGLRCVVGF